jgi:uncharacterized protein (TIGR02266 family)
VDISHGGIFIRTKDPLPVGTALRFEFQLRDATPLITGDGTVVWTREFDPSRSGVAPGMGVRFDRMPNESQGVLDQILAHKQGRTGSEVDAFTEVPTKVAPASLLDGVKGFMDVPTRVTPAHMLRALQDGGPLPSRAQGKPGPARTDASRDDRTPLPKPLPFHADLDEFPDEAFEEATKVAALEALAKKTAERESGADGYASSMDDDVTRQRIRRATSPSDHEAEQALSRNAEAEDEAARARLFASGSSAGPAVTESSGATAGDANEDAGEDAREASEAGEGKDARAANGAPRAGVAQANDEDEDAAPHHVDDEDSSASGTYSPISAARLEPPTAVATRPEPEQERDGSSLPWIAAAALILVVGAVAGVWYLRDRNTGESSEPPPMAGAVPEAEPTAAPSSSPEETEPAARAGIEGIVESEPAGATAELLGAAPLQSGPTPMTFGGLEPGKTYRVRLSHPGYVTAEIELIAGDKPLQPVVLKGKPVVLKVTSEPSGAQVFVDGKRQRSLTPASIPIGAMVAGKRVALSVRKAGFEVAERDVAIAQLSAEGDSIVEEVTLTLARRQPAPRARPKSGGSGGDRASSPGGDAAKSGQDGSQGDKAGSGGEGGKPAGGEESKPTPSSASDGATTDKGEPTPDWMKK